MKMLFLAAFAAALQPATYVVHAQMPRGENLAATVHVAEGDSVTVTPAGGSMAPILEIVADANAVAQASIHGKSTTQILLGPQRTCVKLSLTTNGDTVVATGSAKLPPPPPPPPNGGDNGPPPRGNNGPPPHGDADVNVRITATIDHQQLTSAHGEMGRFTWSLTKTGE